MQNREKIAELETLLPFGAKKEISKRAKVSIRAVTSFFSYEISRVSIYDKILKTTIEYIKERKEQEDELFSQVLPSAKINEL